MEIAADIAELRKVEEETEIEVDNWNEEGIQIYEEAQEKKEILKTT